MPYYTIEPLLPRRLSTALFGDRARFGPLPDPTDESWIEWQSQSTNFYNSTQGRGIGTAVNHAGYKVMSKVDIAGKRVLEIGPAAMHHALYWNGRPATYTCVDIKDEYLSFARLQLDKLEIPYEAVLIEDPSQPLPFANDSFDVVVSFYSLEHIFPLAPQLREMRRVLAPSGQLVGAIPCEGGLAWAIGRYLTSRRWLLANTDIDPNRIICWEHPNFAKSILDELRQQFAIDSFAFWPLVVPLIDANLVVKFICSKRSETHS